METTEILHRYAVVKLYPGLDETVFQKLLVLSVFYYLQLKCRSRSWRYVNGLGLDVVFTNDPSNCYEMETEDIKESNVDAIPENLTEDQEDAQVNVEHKDKLPPEAVETTEYVDLDMKKSNNISASHEVTVQCEVGEPIVLTTDDISGQTLTCMICQQEVLRDKKSLKLHVQTHSGKRYGCSRCKYHTDRKFDVERFRERFQFTRHLRRRHEGEPDPSEEATRPHWMTMLRSCFPSYGDFTKLRKIRRSKITAVDSEKCDQPTCEDRSFSVVPTTDCSTIVC
ncbi:hypothetical protein DICVIV_00117 [Dictyocaulus viviparus]|uniref:C2H2-type domain-containing protein n=1 Tax=Dictyocaulus viviparus TaxID=29172 RepID=A0A0D8YA57_DICVI|nr:hypothetical protein DICVIV_00117 [Dictyocaulus viviparus]